MSAVVAAIDWDVWRAEYDTMSFADQQAFYQRVADLHPEQRSANIPRAHAAFDGIGGEDLTVVELGGWDGTLAASMLTRGDVCGWTNFDIVGVPQRCARLEYHLIVLDDHLWNVYEPFGDVFVATHTIEHLKARELKLLFDCLRVDWIYLEAPLDDGPRDWAGYPGSHVLEIGWDGVNDLLSERGWVALGGGLWGRG